MTSSQSSAALIGDPAYPLLKAYLVSSTGLAYYDGRDDILADIVAHRLAQLNLSTCAAYLRLLQSGGGHGELRIIADRMAVGETYFFRNQDHFNALRDRIVPELLRRKARER